MGLARAGWLLAVVGACSFNHGVGDNGGGGGEDASIDVDATDGPPITPPADARMCFGSFINICLTSLPTNDYTVATATDVNTDTGCGFAVPQPQGQPLCAVVAKTMHINAQLRAIGSRP